MTHIYYTLTWKIQGIYHTTARNGDASLLPSLRQLHGQGLSTSEPDCIHGAFWAKTMIVLFYVPANTVRLYGRQFLQVKRPNQQYQSAVGTNSTQTNQTYNKETWTQNTASPIVYNNMGWLEDGSNRGQGCQAWRAVGLPPRYPQLKHTIRYDRRV